MSEYEDLIFPDFNENVMPKRTIWQRLAVWWHKFRGRKIECIGWDTGSGDYCVETVIEYDKKTGFYNILSCQTYEDEALL
jgi:hypothetical protein